MARPTTISDDKILAAAREVFLEHGIGATTAEVAKKARVAEGSIFKRWKTKQHLFFAALTPETKEPHWLNDLQSKVGKGDLVDTLTSIALESIAHFKKLMPLVMMMWSNPTANGLPAPLAMPNSKPVQGLRLLARFFEAEMVAGRIERRDPEVCARMFMGAIQNYTFLEMLDRHRNELPMPAEMYVRGFVNLLWNGLRPETRRTKEKTR